MKYRREVILLFIVTVVYFAIFFIITSTPLLSAGNLSLSQSDWLEFFGVYLSFAGAVFIGFEASWLTEDRNREIDERRWREIHPILVVEAVAMNVDANDSLLKQSADVDNNAHIRIKNICGHPAINIVLNDLHIANTLESKGTIDVVCCWSCFDNTNFHNTDITFAQLNNTGKALELENGFPARITLQYADIDGRVFSRNYRADVLGNVFYSPDEPCLEAGSWE